MVAEILSYDLVWNNQVNENEARLMWDLFTPANIETVITKHRARLNETECFIMEGYSNE